MSSCAPPRFSGLRLRRMQQHFCLMVFLAGAVPARARNAPAIAYNPAGIALSDRTVLAVVERSGYTVRAVL